MERRAHLTREREEGCYAVVAGDYHSELVHDLLFARFPKSRAYKSVREYLRRVGVKKLRDPGNPVADDVVQQSARKLAHPMLPVPQERFCISAAHRHIVAVIALH